MGGYSLVSHQEMVTKRKETPMALQMRIEVSSGVAATEVPDDIATELQEAYDALKPLPVNRVVVVDFTAEDYAGPKKIDGKDVTADQMAAWNARRFVRQG